MSNKYRLRGTSIRIGDDLTHRESQVQDLIKGVVEEARKKGISANSGYIKWSIGADEYFCQEKGRKIDIRRFRRDNDY